MHMLLHDAVLEHTGEQYQLVDLLMRPGDTRKQSQWNHIWHPSHCTIFLPACIREPTMTVYFNHFLLEDFIGFLAAMLCEGKGNTAPFWKHCSKCFFRIKSWSNSSIQRSCTLHIAVAVAIAKKATITCPGLLLHLDVFQYNGILACLQHICNNALK